MNECIDKADLRCLFFHLAARIDQKASQSKYD
jgi:hypothetical protein